MPLDGEAHQRARIPPSWSLRLNIKDAAGLAFTWDLHFEVSRGTTIGDVRAAAASHAAKALEGVGAERISVKLDGRLGELSDSDTVEDVDLFSRAEQLRVVVRES